MRHACFIFPLPCSSSGDFYRRPSRYSHAKGRPQDIAIPGDPVELLKIARSLECVPSWKVPPPLMVSYSCFGILPMGRVGGWDILSVATIRERAFVLLSVHRSRRVLVVWDSCNAGTTTCATTCVLLRARAEASASYPLSPQPGDPSLHPKPVLHPLLVHEHRWRWSPLTGSGTLTSRREIAGCTSLASPPRTVPTARTLGIDAALCALRVVLCFLPVALGAPTSRQRTSFCAHARPPLPLALVPLRALAQYNGSLNILRKRCPY
jgi:hypothetical protein